MPKSPCFRASFQTAKSRASLLPGHRNPSQRILMQRSGVAFNRAVPTHVAVLLLFPSLPRGVLGVRPVARHSPSRQSCWRCRDCHQLSYRAFPSVSTDPKAASSRLRGFVQEVTVITHVVFFEVFMNLCLATPCGTSNLGGGKPDNW